MRRRRGRGDWIKDFDQERQGLTDGQTRLTITTLIKLDRTTVMSKRCLDPEETRTEAAQKKHDMHRYAQINYCRHNYTKTLIKICFL